MRMQTYLIHVYVTVPAPEEVPEDEFAGEERAMHVLEWTERMNGTYGNASGAYSDTYGPVSWEYGDNAELVKEFDEEEI